MAQAGQHQEQSQLAEAALSQRGADAEFLGNARRNVQETEDGTGDRIGRSEMIEITPQGAAESLDARRIPVGDIGDGTGLDLAILAVRLADQDGGQRGTIGDGGDIDAFIISVSDILARQTMHKYMPT